MVLDAVDATLVRALQGDGRATYQALAERVGLSRTAVRARVRHLVETGVIHIAGALHTAVTGREIFSHISLRVSGPVRPVLDRVAARAAVTFAAQTTGRFPVVAHVRVGDDTTLAAELAAIRRLPGVMSVEVFRGDVLAEDTDPAGRAPRDVTIDPLDWRLIRRLQQDGRASYAELARHVGLSQAAARSRVVRLIEAGVLHVTALVNPSAMGTTEHVGFGVRSRGDTARLAADLDTMTEVSFVASGFGRYELLGNVTATDQPTLAEVLDTLRALPDVTDLETWQHLVIAKEHRQADTLPPLETDRLGK